MADDTSRWARLIDEAPFLVALDDSSCTLSFLDEVQAESCLLEVIGCREASQASTDDECVKGEGGGAIHSTVSWGYILSKCQAKIRNIAKIVPEFPGQKACSEGTYVSSA